MTALADMPEVLTVEETAGLLRIGRSSAYQAIRAGEIPSIRLGRKCLVPRARLEDMLGQQRPRLGANRVVEKEGAGAAHERE